MCWDSRCFDDSENLVFPFKTKQFHDLFLLTQEAKVLKENSKHNVKTIKKLNAKQEQNVTIYKPAVNAVK